MAQREPRGHRLVAHTADVIVEAWGPDLASCVEEALAAVVEGCVDAGSARVVAEHVAVLGPGTPESLVLDALDELIFVLDTSVSTPVAARVRPTGHDERLEVAFRLADPATVAPTGAGPKAVSRSGFSVETNANFARCRFLVDV